MRLLLLSTAVLVFVGARSTPIQDKIKRILDFMQTVRGNGALAISTPTGLWPVEMINEANIPDIFGFHEGLRRELEEAKAEARSKGKDFIQEQFSSDNDVNLKRRESKLPFPAPRPAIRPRPRGRLPHPVHPSGYNAANDKMPSFGGFFNPPFDSDASVNANDETRKESIGWNRSNHGFNLPPTNVHVDAAPEFGDDISVGLGTKDGH